MKMQVDGQQLRLRLSESELDTLTLTGRLEATLRVPAATWASRVLMLHSGLTEPACSGDLMNLQILLPLDAFLEFAQERPRRDGFKFCSEGLHVSVEVDVRDSRRRRSSENGGRRGQD